MTIPTTTASTSMKTNGAFDLAAATSMQYPSTVRNTATCINAISQYARSLSWTSNRMTGPNNHDYQVKPDNV